MARIKLLLLCSALTLDLSCNVPQRIRSLGLVVYAPTDLHSCTIKPHVLMFNITLHLPSLLRVFHRAFISLPESRWNHCLPSAKLARSCSVMGTGWLTKSDISSHNELEATECPVRGDRFLTRMPGLGQLDPCLGQAGLPPGVVGDLVPITVNGSFPPPLRRQRRLGSEHDPFEPLKRFWKLFVFKFQPFLDFFAIFGAARD